MKIFEAGTKAMISADKDGGHIGSEDPNWGRYEVMFRAALELLRDRGIIHWDDADSILKGDA